MPAELVTRDMLVEDAVFILQCLRESARTGRSTHLMDVKHDLENALTLEFGDYLRFLRQSGYVVLERDPHAVAMTAEGERACAGADATLFRERLERFFAAQLAAGFVEYAEVTPAAPQEAAAEARPVSFDPSAAEGEPLYLRQESLGRGPLGTVFRASHAALEVPLAIKELHDPTGGVAGLDAAVVAERLAVELSRQARLRHPGVLGVFDLDLSAPQPFVVLELAEGGNLRARLRARGGEGLAAEEALRAFAQITAGLAAAHVQGFTHHNLKPENVLFDRCGNARLGDFGLARVFVAEGTRRVIDPGAMSYLAPEQMQPGSEAGPAADVYALGILLYEALTGRVPGRRSPLPSQAVAGVPEAVDGLFDRMTADRAVDRPADAGAVLAELLAVFADGRFGRPGEALVRTTPVLDG